MKLKEVQPFPAGKAPRKGSIFRGVTLEAGDPKHTHPFEIRYDRNGKIVSGKTLPDDSGYTHKITSPSRTQSARGHSHPLPIPSGGRGFVSDGSGGRTPPGGPGSMTGGGTGGGGQTGTGAGTGTPGTGTPGGGGNGG